MEQKKVNWFVRVLIILLCLFIGGIIYVNLFWSRPFGQITSGLLILISFLIILALSEAFDNFSLGKLLSISRKAQEKEVQNKELKKENTDLRNQIINITTSISQKQVNSTYVVTDELKKMFSVKQADEPEKQQKEKEAQETTTTTTTTEQQLVKKFISPSRFEEVALPKFLQQENLNQFPLIRDAKFVSHFQQIDPVSEYSPIFDAYIKTADIEIFIEMRVKAKSMMLLRERLYLMLSKINYYRNIKRINAYLFLVLITKPDDDSGNGFLERLLIEFEPALTNGLLRISQVDITQEEINLIDAAENP